MQCWTEGRSSTAVAEDLGDLMRSLMEKSLNLDYVKLSTK